MLQATSPWPPLTGIAPDFTASGHAAGCAPGASRWAIAPSGDGPGNSMC